MDDQAKDQFGQEVEDHLIDIGGWAIQSVKLSGFFPLYISKNTNSLSSITGTPTKILKPIQIRRLSIYSAYLGTLNLLGIVFAIYGIGVSYKTIKMIQAGNARDSNVKTQNSFSDEEDNFIATYNGMAMVLVSAILRFKYISSPKKTLEFWHHFVNLLKGFNHLNIFQTGNPHFDSAKRRVKRFSGIFIFITLVQTGVMFYYVYHLYHNSMYKKGSARGRYLYEDSDKTISCLLGIASLFLILFIHIQIGFFIWLGFIIEIYATCFTAIGDAVRDEISRKKLDPDTSICYTTRKNLWKSVWGKNLSGEMTMEQNRQNGERESKLSKLLTLYEEVCESTEEFNKFYTFPMMIDVFVCITNSFASIYAINKIMYLYGVQHEAAGNGNDRESFWDQSIDLLYRLPSHWAFTWRVISLALASNRVTQESLKVVDILQHEASKCAFVLNDFALQSQVQMLVTRASAKPPGISPGNYFTLGKSFMVSLLSVLVTYFLILTEFREKSEGWNSIRKLNLSCHQ